jgi:hypothetical protein
MGLNIETIILLTRDQPVSADFRHVAFSSSVSTGASGTALAWKSVSNWFSQW